MMEDMLAETFIAKAEGFPCALALAQLPAFLGSGGLKGTAQVSTASPSIIS